MPLLDMNQALAERIDAITQLKQRIRILESGNHINHKTIMTLQKKNKRLETKLSACINSWENLQKVLNN